MSHPHSAPGGSYPGDDATQPSPVPGAPAYQSQGSDASAASGYNPAGSGPPTAGPTYAPVSADPYGGSTFPSYGGPVADLGSGAAVPRRRGGVIALAAAAVLFLLATGVLTALFVTKTNEADRTRRDLTAQVASRDSTISDRDRQVEQLKKDLQAKTEELDDAKQSLTGSQNQVTELNRQKDVIAKCIRLLGENKVREAEPVCKEADRILNL